MYCKNDIQEAINIEQEEKKKAKKAKKKHDGLPMQRYP